MLRGRPERAAVSGSTRLSDAGDGAEAGYPTLEEPFAVEDRAVGVRFYKAKESCFHPYALLQSMHLGDGKLTLAFAGADVVLEGRGLHRLYVLLAAQRVSRIVEQGDRYATASEAATVIVRVEWIAK